MKIQHKAVADMHDGATLLVGGFGGSGLPSHLIAALVEQGAKDLTVVSNNIGAVSDGVAALNQQQSSTRKLFALSLLVHTLTI